MKVCITNVLNWCTYFLGETILTTMLFYCVKSCMIRSMQKTSYFGLMFTILKAGPLIKITRSQEKPILKKCILAKIDLQPNFKTKLCSKLLKWIITIYRTLHFELYEPLFQTSTSCLHLNKIADMVWNELDQIDQVMDPR